jgi:outer membrane biosynthesis protein TonB
VTTVSVGKSSGSNDIDQPTRVAIYDWWFEPKLDRTGKAVPDRVQFTINWR